MLIIWIFYFIFGCSGNLALNQAYVVLFFVCLCFFVLFSFYFLGTVVKYLDIGNVLFLQPWYSGWIVKYKFCEISKIKIILITLFTDLKDVVITSLLRGKTTA